MSRHTVREIDGQRVGMQASKIRFDQRYAVYDPDHPGDMEHLQEVIVDKIISERTENGPGGISSQVVKAHYVNSGEGSRPWGEKWEGHPNELLGEPELFTQLVERAQAKKKAETDKLEATKDLAATAIKMLQSVGLDPRYRDYTSYRDRDKSPRPDEFEFDTPERIEALIRWMQSVGVAIPNDITLEKMER